MSVDLLLERTNRGLSQEAMAKEIGVTRRVYQAAEQGTRVPRGHNARRFAHFFRCDIADIFPPRRQLEEAA